MTKLKVSYQILFDLIPKQFFNKVLKNVTRYDKAIQIFKTKPCNYSFLICNFYWQAAFLILKLIAL